jgi:hypothetical protein
VEGAGEAAGPDVSLKQLHYTITDYWLVTGCKDWKWGWKW